MIGRDTVIDSIVARKAIYPVVSLSEKFSPGPDSKPGNTDPGENFSLKLTT